MKILIVSFLVIYQSAEAKIADFNTLINEHSKSQNEIHHSIKAEVAVDVQVNPDEQDKKAEVIVLETANYEVFSQPKKQKKTGKKSQLKKNQPADNIEDKQFLRLGEELNEAH